MDKNGNYIMKDHCSMDFLELINYIVWVDGTKFDLLCTPKDAIKYALKRKLTVISFMQAKEMGLF